MTDNGSLTQMPGRKQSVWKARHQEVGGSAWLIFSCTGLTVGFRKTDPSEEPGCDGVLQRKHFQMWCGFTKEDERTCVIVLDSTLVFSLLLRFWIIDGQVSAHSPGGFIGGAFGRQSNIRPQPAFRKLCASCDFIAVTVVVLFTWSFWVFFEKRKESAFFSQ